LTRHCELGFILISLATLDQPLAKGFAHESGLVELLH
jgi:hypothetical protein